MVPVHREGWPFVAAFAAAAIVLGWFWDPLFWIGLALPAWFAYFFLMGINIPFLFSSFTAVYL